MPKVVSAGWRLLLALSLLLASSAPGVHAKEPDKYGFLGNTDADLALSMRRVPAVILGRIDHAETKKWGSLYQIYSYQVRVIESYKGPLDPGESVGIHIQAEGGPESSKMLGKTRYFLLTPERDEDGKAVKDDFDCEWTDSLGYDRYGKAPGIAFRNAPKVEIGLLDQLLKLSPRQKEVGADYDNFSPTPSVRWQTVLSVRWISRADILARKHFWQECFARGRISGDIPDAVKSFQFLDTSVCEYRQEIEDPEGGVDWVGNEFLPQGAVWKRWISPEKGFEVYNDFVAGLAKQAQMRPTETSCCVMMSFVSEGKLMERHFYLPSRFPLHRLLHEIQQTGTDCTGWDKGDARMSMPDWMAQKLGYDTRIWSE